MSANVATMSAKGTWIPRMSAKVATMSAKDATMTD